MCSNVLPCPILTWDISNIVQSSSSEPQGQVQPYLTEGIEGDFSFCFGIVEGLSGVSKNFYWIVKKSFTKKKKIICRSSFIVATTTCFGERVGPRGFCFKSLFTLKDELSAYDAHVIMNHAHQEVYVKYSYFQIRYC